MLLIKGVEMVFDNTSRTNNNQFPDEWVMLSDIVLLIAYNRVLKQKIYDSFMDLFRSGTHGNWIKCIGKNNYKFNKTHLEEFCELYGFDLVAPIDRNAPDYKSAEWLRCKELRNYLPGSESQIRDVLRIMQHKMPDAIQNRRNGPFVHLCLNIKYIDTIKNIMEYEYSKQVHNTKPISAGNKMGADEWVGPAEIRNLIFNGIEERQRLHDSLMDLYTKGQHPDWIRQIKSTRYLFNKKYLSDFCKMYGFGIKDKRDNSIKWLTVVELQHIISKPNEQFSKTLTAALQDLYSKGAHPDWVYHPSTKRYYLNAAYVSDFAKMYNFNLICPDKRTDDWLSATEISMQINASVDKIIKLLTKHQSDMPEWIQTKRKKQLPCLCLHRDHIKEFCAVAQLTLNDRSTKTSDWYSVAEHRLFLKNFDETTQMNALIQAFEEVSKTHPDWIQPKTTKNGVSKLCLNKKHIQDFCDLTGFICDTQKTEQWLNAEDLGLMLNISPSKIAKILEAHKNTNPDIIQIKHNNSWWYLCLHQDYVYKIQGWLQNTIQRPNNNVVWDTIQKLYSR